MKIHIVTGGCGFVGRNMVKRLLQTTEDYILFIDDLSVGIKPQRWLEEPIQKESENWQVLGETGRLIYVEGDARIFFRASIGDVLSYVNTTYGLQANNLGDVFHFAAIVGGRAMIDGDPIKVGLDLSIDAEFFYWVTRVKPQRVLYPSSSAAYPVSLQTDTGALQLKEEHIDFDNMGKPDMTYGWTKLTGEFLAQITAQHYNIPITCIRPFSGYGADQDLTYPIPAIALRAANKENPFEVWGTGKQGRDFVYIDDVIDCILLAMEHIADGSAINIGMGKLTSFLEIIEVFTKFAGYKPTIKPLLDKPVGVHSRYCDMTHVKNTLGWEAKISIEEGMRRVYEAALKNK